MRGERCPSCGSARHGQQMLGWTPGPGGHQHDPNRRSCADCQKTWYRACPECGDAWVGTNAAREDPRAPGDVSWRSVL